MPDANIIKAFFQQSDATGAKSTVLKPLGWLIGILVSASIASFYFNSPNWVGFTFVLFTGISILLYLISYIYFMRRDPDFLRSESFTLRKLEIEKGIIGDSLTGIVETTSVEVPSHQQTIDSLPSGEDDK